MVEGPLSKVRQLPTLPERATVAGEAYFRAVNADLSLFYFVADLVLRSDYVAFVAGRALAGSDEYTSMSPSKLSEVDPGPATKFLRRNRYADGGAFRNYPLLLGRY